MINQPPMGMQHGPPHFGDGMHPGMQDMMGMGGHMNPSMGESHTRQHSHLLEQTAMMTWSLRLQQTLPRLTTLPLRCTVHGCMATGMMGPPRPPPMLPGMMGPPGGHGGMQGPSPPMPSIGPGMMHGPGNHMMQGMQQGMPMQFNQINRECYWHRGRVSQAT